MPFVVLVIAIIVLAPVYEWAQPHFHTIGMVICAVIAFFVAWFLLVNFVLLPRAEANTAAMKERERTSERDRALAIGETVESRLRDRYVKFCGEDIMRIARLRYDGQVPTASWVAALKDSLERKLRPDVTDAEYDLAMEMIMGARAGRSNVLTAPIEARRATVQRERESAAAQARGDHIRTRLSDGSVVSGVDFEDWCQHALEHQGWKVQRTPGSGDQGVDLVCTHRGHKIVIQCKHYSKTIGNGAVQEVISGKVFYSASLGVVVSSGATYSPSAVRLADAAGVLLISGDEIFGIDQRIGWAAT